MLAYFHSVKANMMQMVIGNALFTASVHQLVHGMLGCMGIMTALSWDALQVDLVRSDDCYHPPIPPLFQSDLVRLLDRYYFFLFP